MNLTPDAIEGFVKTILWKNYDDPAPIPDFHRELWELCCSDNPLVAIAAPRGHAKSTAVTLAYLLVAVLSRTSQYVLLISDTEGQAQQFLGDIKKELQGNDKLISLFGVKRFEKDQETDIIVVMDDGYKFRVTAKGSEQKVRGLKWENKRPDLIIGDDLENDEIVMNDERRLKFRNWMIKALMPCRSPKGKIRLVGTILHLDSFLARVVPMEGERDTVDMGLKCVSTNKRKSWLGVLYRAHKGSLPKDIEQPSDVLWSERFDRKYFEAKYQEAFDAGLSEGYSQEQLNRPLDGSTSVFRKSDMVPIKDEEKKQIASGVKPLLYYAGGDCAITLSEKADYTVFIVVGIDSDGIMYVVDVIRDRFDGKEIVDKILYLQNTYRLQWLALEQDKTSKSIAPFLATEMLKHGNEPVNIVPIVPHTDKTARTSSIVARMRVGAVRFDKTADWFPTLENEFLTFPRGKKDDQVDAFSCIGLALRKMQNALTQYEQEQDEYDQHMEQHGQINDGRDPETGY